MGKVVSLAAPYAGGLAAAKVIIPELKTAAIIDGGEFDRPLALAGDHLFVNRVAGGPNEVTIYDLAGGHATPLGLPAGRVPSTPSRLCRTVALSTAS